MRIEAERWVNARHEILEKLGEGGMGVVYKARDKQLDRLVALKFLAANLEESRQAHDRSIDEARAIAALNHPNVATIYEISESAGAPVLILEYLPGGTLRSRIAPGRLSVEEIVEYGLQIAEGLAHAHAHGIIHGDVKPENVLFTADGTLKITDFGLARFEDARTVAVDRTIAGTLKYMAPECLDEWPADCETDVFSAGVVLEEMAAAAAVPETFRELVARATARNRAQRFQSMEELAAALRRLEPTKNRGCETPTILVVEDDDILRGVLETGLADEGYRVLIAGNGRDAIRLAAEEAPHLVLLDVTLPGLNGFDVCRELRHQGFNAPIMMVTGKTQEVDRVVGLEIGADDYLTKPFGQRELVARVRVHLRRAYDMDASRRFFHAAQR
ncbi:MAG: protein kinase [Acidobacteria bacterium]|nr:protein kinase [Acidobacteriota bacterium]